MKIALFVTSGLLMFGAGAKAQELQVVYPPVAHETTAKQIFLLGSAGPEGQVLVNGKAIDRNRSGHFRW
jgi:N-acetylmuramoyl-L-alanine amidase